MGVATLHVHQAASYKHYYFSNGLHLASVRDQFQQAFYEEEQGEQRIHDMEDIG